MTAPRIVENGRNTTTIEADGFELYFSYKTLIGFRTPAGRLVVRRNDWGPTTGKHLNAIDGGDKDARLTGPDFEAAYHAAQQAE